MATSVYVVCQMGWQLAKDIDIVSYNGFGCWNVDKQPDESAVLVNSVAKIDDVNALIEKLHNAYATYETKDETNSYHLAYVTDDGETKEDFGEEDFFSEIYLTIHHRNSARSAVISGQIFDAIEKSMSEGKDDPSEIYEVIHTIVNKYVA